MTLSQLVRYTSDPNMNAAAPIKQHKILVLGQKVQSRQVSSYRWSEIPSQINVTDFDTVILNFSTISDSNKKEAFKISEFPRWEQFSRLFRRRESQIITIGLFDESMSRNAQDHLSLTQLGSPFEAFVVCDPGTAFNLIADEFEGYFRMLSRWKVFLEGIKWFDEQGYFFAGLYSKDLGKLHPRIDPIATTTFHKPIAFSLQASPDRATPPMSGRLISLPPPTERSSEDGVIWILRNLYGLLLERQQPDWLASYKLPGEPEIHTIISQYEQKISETQKKIEAAKLDLEKLTRFKKLLYEQDEALEQIVRDSLRVLGATVTDPERKGREDGRLVDPFGRKGMLEVKGRTGTLRVQDVRQLEDWVQGAAESENWPSKGLLIANLMCNIDPDSRKDLVPSNCSDLLSRYHSCLITTSQLFQALVQQLSGTLDSKNFWDTIFSTDGICSLPEATPPPVIIPS